MKAWSIREASDNLLVAPRPVLFLDTCDIVNLFQVVTTTPVAELKAVNRLLSALQANPLCCQLIGTYVTAVEYGQKTDPKDLVYQKESLNKKLPPDAVMDRLADLDEQILRLHLIREELGRRLPMPAIRYSDLDLVGDLRATAELLIDGCWALQRDDACVGAAIERVFGKVRPSQTREVKDSIHLEHCLALARNLRLNGFIEPVLFTSANKNDSGPAVGTQPHQELQADFAGVGMSYFESLSRGIAHLGI